MVSMGALALPAMVLQIDSMSAMIEGRREETNHHATTIATILLHRVFIRSLYNGLAKQRRSFRFKLYLIPLRSCYGPLSTSMACADIKELIMPQCVFARYNRLLLIARPGYKASVGLYT